MKFLHSIMIYQIKILNLVKIIKKYKHRNYSIMNSQQVH